MRYVIVDHWLRMFSSDYMGERESKDTDATHAESREVRLDEISTNFEPRSLPSFSSFFHISTLTHSTWQTNLLLHASPTISPISILHHLLRVRYSNQLLELHIDKPV